MYCNFFGLRCRPFEDHCDTRFFYATADSEETLAAMEYEAHYGMGMVLVTGEAGTGKTLLIRSLLQRLTGSDQVVVLTWPSNGQMELLRETAKGFGVSLPTSNRNAPYRGYHEARCHARLRRHLTRTLKADHCSILIIDQAENLSANDMGQLATLAELEDNGGRLLNIMLVGQPRIRSVLDRSEFARVSQRLGKGRVLPPLTLSETEQYVQHRLRIAGAVNELLFDKQAVALIHEAAGGTPRIVNHMCDAAMLAAYGAGAVQVSRETAAEVTTMTHLRERAVPAHKLGVDTVERVAAGLTGTAPSSAAAKQLTAGVILSGYRPPASAPSCAPPRPATAVNGDGITTAVEVDAGSALKRVSAGDSVGGDAANMDWSETPPALPESTLAHGEELLNRLERALARADRMHVTTEASLTQFTAVERHLSSLAGTAERLVGNLAGAVQRSTESLDTVKRRLDETLGQAEDRMRTMEGQLSRAAEAVSDAEEQSSRTVEAYEHADRVESHLKSLAEQLADKADEVQDRVALLMTHQAAGEEAHDKLDGLIERASSATTEAEATFNDLRNKLQEALDKGERLHDRLTDSALESYTASAEDQIAKANERIEQVAREAVETVQDKLDSLVSRTSSVTADADHGVDLLQTTLDQIKQDVEDAVSNGQRKVDETLHALDQQIDHRQEQLEGLERRRDEVQLSLAALMDETARTDSNVQKLTETVHDANVSVDELTHRADAARENLTNTIPHGEKLLLDVTAACGQIESVQRSVGTTLIEIGGASECANALRDQASQCQEVLEGLAFGKDEGEQAARQLEEVASSAQPLLEILQHTVEDAGQKSDRLESQNHTADQVLDRLSQANATAQTVIEQVNESTGKAEKAVDAATEQTTRLATAQAAGDDTVQHLDELVTSGSRLHEAMQGVIAHTDEKVNQLDSHNAAATNVLHDLSEANRTGQTIIEQVNESTGKAEKAADAAVEQATRLETAQTTGDDTVQHLDELVTSGSQLHEAMQGLIAYTDEKVSQLDSHNAAATNVLCNLTEANVTGHSLVERIDESKRVFEKSTDDARGEIDRLTQDVWALSARAEAKARELDVCNTRAGELIDKLSTSTVPADKIATDLARYVDQAQQYVTTMAERCEHAGKLTERLKSIASLVTAVKETEASIKEATFEARSTYDQLAEMADTVQEHRATLQESSAAAQRLIDTYEQMMRDTETATERLGSQLTATEKLLDTGKPMLSDFVAQARRLQQQLQNMKGNAARIEQTISDSMTRPAKIVANAQAQATQLERVCTAVRKVFSSLSQASLEARSQSTECTQANRETAERLSQLTTQTNRAANMLHEWVEEALRAQSRLEKTLEQCPSIQETHPADTIRRMSPMTSPAARIANPSTRGELELLSEPTTTDPPRPEGTPKAETRVEEVSQLIEEARQAVADAKT